MGISSLSKKYTSLDHLQKAIELSLPKIGSSGGRFFQLTPKLSVKFKELIALLQQLAKKELSSAGTNKTKVERKVREITEILADRDILGDAMLGKASSKQKILTAIRRFFGNFGRSSHIKKLATIFKLAVPGMKDSAPKVAELCSKFKKFSKDHKTFILGTERAFKNRMKAKSLPDEESAEKVSDKAEKELESLIDDLEQLPLAGQIKFLEKIQHMLASKIIYINASNKELNVMLYQHRDIRKTFLHEIANNLE